MREIIEEERSYFGKYLFGEEVEVAELECFFCISKDSFEIHFFCFS